jgi:peptidyl-prolyl cis-trans isomerase D
MSVIQNIRDKYIGIVVTTIVVALVGFLIMDAMQSNVRNIFSSDRTLLAEINGKRIDAKNFEAIRQRYEDNMKAQKKGQALTETEKNSLNDQVWNDILNENLVASENEKLGIALTDKELQDMEVGPYADPMIKQSFTDPNTGIFDPSKVSEYLTSLSQGKGEEQVTKRNQWREFEESMIKSRMNSKYNDLVTKGIYIPTFVLNDMARERASIAAISYVKLPYEMINDNEVKVSDDDIKAFMKKKENLLKSEEAMANADYVVFDIVPTADDSAASLGLLNKIRGEFDSTKNNEEFVNQYSEESMKDIFMSQDKLPADKAAEIMAAGVGTVIGPFLDNGSFKLVKVTDKKTLPDSVKASHILIGIGQQRSEEAAKLIIDSIETAIKGGANFEQMAATRSEDKGSAQKGGDLGYFGQGQMVAEFNDACFNGKVGDLKVVKTQFGYHLIRVQDQKDFKPGVKLATVVKALQSSEATIQAVYAKAAEFKSKANDSKSFAETAKKMSKDKRVASSITKTQQVLPGLGSAREISRWMFDAKIGEVSGVFNLSDKCVIANLTSRQEKGSLPDVATIRPQLEYYLKREKKGQMLMEKAKGKTSLDQIAALGATTVKNIDSLLLAGGGNDSLGYEPKVIGAAFNKALLNKVSPGIPGEQGVFFVNVRNINQPPLGKNEPNPAMNMERQQQMQQMAGQMQGSIPQALKKKAKIVDNRSNFF